MKYLILAFFFISIFCSCEKDNEIPSFIGGHGTQDTFYIVPFDTLPPWLDTTDAAYQVFVEREEAYVFE